LQATEEKFRRIDLQVLSMIVDARATLQRTRGVTAGSKSIFIGFSAAGHFATRMAILHPERVLAVWAGGMGGHPIVPMAEWNGKPLTYPVGNSDLLDLIGHKFQHEHFRGLNVMLVQGVADTNTSLPSDPKPSDSYTFEQAELIRALLGNDSVQRLNTAKSIWEKAGAKVQMKVYPDAGHQITPEIARDMIAFLEACRPNSK
jgi:pimeloyl-ACP methyl ester carboxylesterase